MRGSWRLNRTATYWPPLLWPSAFLSRSPGLLNRRPGGPTLCWVLAFSTASCHQLVWSPKLTDFLSSPSYIIVQLPTQYLPITGHRNVSLPPSLEWHVWWSCSSQVTLFRCISLWLYRGILTLSHIVSQAHPRQWNMQLPHLWNGMSGQVEGRYTTFVHCNYKIVLLFHNSCCICKYILVWFLCSLAYQPL